MRRLVLFDSSMLTVKLWSSLLKAVEPIDHTVVIHRGSRSTGLPQASYMQPHNFNMEPGVDYKVVFDNRRLISQGDREAQLRETLRVVMYGLRHSSPRSVEVFELSDNHLSSFALV